MYIIHKRFPPRDNSKVFNLFKVGYTDIEKDGQLSRLDGFRTTLISFKVHRIYCFLKTRLDAELRVMPRINCTKPWTATSMPKA